MISCYSVTGHQNCIELIQWSLYDVMLFSNWSSRLSLNSLNGHYLKSCYSVTGQKVCHWTHSMSLCDVMLIKNWSSSLSLNSFNGHYMMSCYSVTGHQDCPWAHSMAIIWCHAIQLLVIKIAIELIQRSIYDVLLFSNWSSRLPLN